VVSISARIVPIVDGWLQLRWRIDGNGALIIPSFAGKSRADGLWHTTCFELFIRADDSERYCEINLSPSERWAAYNFATYREGRTKRPIPHEPVCTLRRGSSFALFDAAIRMSVLPAPPWEYGLAAVIEEEGAVKSYWALAHPPGKPDFHHPTCFAATLPAPKDS
jgi:hypothetical protein